MMFPYSGYRERFDFIPEADIEELENKDQEKSLALLERIDRIVKIHSFIKNSRENKEKNANYQKTLDEHLAFCSGLLEITSLQTFLFSYILNSGSLSLGDLAKLLKATRIQCFKYLDDLDVLLDKRLIRKSDRGGEETDSDYWIPYEVIQSLREGKVFTPPRYTDLSSDQFFKYLDKILLELFHTDRFHTEPFHSDHFHNKSSKKILMMDFFNLLEDNPQLEFVKKIKSLSLTEENILFLSFLCTKFYIDREDTFRYRDIHFSEYPENEREINLQQLFKLELIECYGDDFKDKDIIVLTNKAIIELLGITEALHKPELELESNVINHKNIVQKELFYNAREGRLIEQLTDLLYEKN